MGAWGGVGVLSDLGVWTHFTGTVCELCAWVGGGGVGGG